jgi:hypothetical protein
MICCCNTKTILFIITIKQTAIVPVSSKHFKKPSELVKSEAVTIHLVHAIFEPHSVIGKSIAHYHCKEDIISSVEVELRLREVTIPNQGR